MRKLTVLMIFAATAPLAAQRNDPLAFLRPPSAVVGVSESYPERLYRPVRTGEVRSAGFLTEMRTLPFGRVLGPVTPPVVNSLESSETALPGAAIAVMPPAGSSYQKGDTVLLARLMVGPAGWGEIVVPTGLAVIGEHTQRQTSATLIVTYGPVRIGQVSLPLERFTNPGPVLPAPATGPSATIVSGREVRELEQVGGVMFIDAGRTAGMKIGDFLEVHRRPAQRLNAADTENDVIAVAQVVGVNEKSSTIRLVRVVDPDIRAGAPIVRISTLPN